jgi:glutamate dehydrogenase/leucine dehydrogenase
VVSDTGAPTAEGNYWMLIGQLKGADIPVKGAVVGLIGAGNIGLHIIDHLLEDGAVPLVVEAKPEIRAALEKRGVKCWAPDGKADFLKQPMDALVLNAAGGSLDGETVKLVAANARLRVINGSENLVMPNPDDEEILRTAKKVFCPCECAGMMGYLTAAEEYLSHLAGDEFTINSMYEAAKALEGPGEKATRHVIAGGYAQTMSQAMEQLYR